MSIDHTPFLEEEYEALMGLPGYPYLRIEPILLLDNNDEVDELWHSAQEELLFSLHGLKGQLLVVSNHRVRVFKITAPRGFIRGSIGFLYDMTSPLAEIGDAIDTVKDLGGAANTFKNWLSPKQRRQRAANKDSGMPNPKEIKDVTWKTKDPETLALVSLYKERILLENAFKWKLLREAYWRNDDKPHLAIHFAESQITFSTLGKKGNTQSDSFKVAEPCCIPEIAELVAKLNFPLIEKSGWNVDLDDGVLLQDASAVVESE